MTRYLILLATLFLAACECGATRSLGCRKHTTSEACHADRDCQAVMTSCGRSPGCDEGCVPTTGGCWSSKRRCRGSYVTGKFECEQIPGTTGGICEKVPSTTRRHDREGKVETISIQDCREKNPLLDCSKCQPGFASCRGKQVCYGVFCG